MSHHSVRARVTLASALALAIGLAVLTVGVNVLLERQLGSDASSALRERADALQSTLGVHAGRVVLHDTPNDEALDQRVWVYVGARALQRPRADPGLQREADALARLGGSVERSVPGHVRLRAEPAYDEQGHQFATVVVGVSLLPYDQTQHLALIATVLLDLFVLLLGSLLARRAVGIALRPVAEMTERAAEWSERDLERRFNLGAPRDELTALSATLDGLLGRLAASLRHEQRFSAELAHELRTPLTGVRGEAELALRDDSLAPDARTALNRILSGTDRMGAVIDTLLATARSNADTPRGAVDARVAASAAIDGVRSAAELAGIDLELSAPEVLTRVGADGDVVVQTLQPLLENALRHAHNAVRLTVAREGDTVAFSVRDDGAGLIGSDVGALFEPGASTSGGPGLGLPLARRLARSCGGDVVEISDGGGGRFDLRLPSVG